MFLLRRPSSGEIERFLSESRDLPLSYGSPGILATDVRLSASAQVKRGRRDEVVVPIGEGAGDFARAREALTTWAHFDLGWVEVFPGEAAIRAGEVVAVLIRHLGFWSLNGCRIISTLGAEPATRLTSEALAQEVPAAHDDEASSLRFGFTYGTLPNHCEAGEELFEIFLDPDGRVMYRIRAISWARAWLAYIGQSIVRLLQKRFRRESVARMRRAVAERR
jgi:uncharacterized protein (UPF0548 family)